MYESVNLVRTYISKIKWSKYRMYVHILVITKMKTIRNTVKTLTL